MQYKFVHLSPQEPIAAARELIIAFAFQTPFDLLAFRSLVKNQRRKHIVQKKISDKKSCDWPASTSHNHTKYIKWVKWPKTLTVKCFWNWPTYVRTQRKRFNNNSKDLTIDIGLFFCVCLDLAVVLDAWCIITSVVRHVDIISWVYLFGTVVVKSQ